MEIVGVLLSAGITMFSLGLLIISIISYLKYRNKKLLLVSIAFLFFLLKGIVLTSYVFFEEFTLFIFFFSVMDLIILVVLFISTLKR